MVNGNTRTNMYDFFYSKGCFPTMDAVIACASHGKLDLLKWLDKKGLHPNIQACSEAFLSGYPKLLEWMIEKGVELTSEVYNSALFLDNRKIETLDLLKEHGCIWNEETFYTATLDYLDFELIKYLYEDGCVPNEQIFLNVINNELKDEIVIPILEWMYDHDFPHDNNECIEHCLTAEDIGRLSWMKSKNFQFTEEQQEQFDFLLIEH